MFKYPWEVGWLPWRVLFGKEITEFVVQKLN